MVENSDESKRNIRQTNALIRALVEQETLNYPFWIGGYITRHFVSDFGHVYFDLVDEDYSINCMVRETVRGALDFPVSNGIDVEVFGTIRVYEKTAKVQIEVEKIRLVDSPKDVIDGSLVEQLEKKGLWPREKRAVPLNMGSLGIITSKQSEALHDFEDTYRQERGAAQTQVIDVRLQGQQAPHEIAEAIQRLNRDQKVDVIALIRGGGRVAELAVFNDLLIAEAICRSIIPVVTGIGHQRDDTLADQVADVSTITPTAAALFLARASQPKVFEPSKPTSSLLTIFIAVGVILLALVVIIVVLLLRS